LIDPMRLEFRGEITYWRGPAPFYFIAVPRDGCREIHAIAPLVTYGWGVIPVTVRLGETEWTTSLFPKDGGYLVPIKDVVRRAEGLALGDETIVALTIGR
jgi:uncharacterized protein DUF1905